MSLSLFFTLTIYILRIFLYIYNNYTCYSLNFFHTKWAFTKMKTKYSTKNQKGKENGMTILFYTTKTI